MGKIAFESLTVIIRYIALHRYGESLFTTKEG
jgi:hypothetical protein